MPPTFRIDRTTTLPTSQIIRLVGEGNYTHVVTTGKTYFMSTTMKILEEKLPGFLRIHKQHLVNPKYIKSIAIKSRRVTVTGNVTLVASRRRANILKPYIADPA